MTTVTPVRPWQDLEGGTTEVEALSRAKGFLSLYNNLDQGMGSFFFLFMSTNQVAWIFYIFITISSLLGGKMDASSLSLSLSFGLGTLGLVIQVVSFTLALDRFGSHTSIILLPFLSPVNLTLAPRCYQGLGRMASELRMKLMISMKEEEIRQREEVNIVLQVKLNTEPHFFVF